MTSFRSDRSRSGIRRPLLHATCALATAFAGGASGQAPLYAASTPTMTVINQGGSMASIGDITGDGVPDIAVKCRIFAHNGVRVLSGATGALVGEITLPSGTGNLHAVGAAGDRDADGFPDLALSTWDSTGPNEQVRFHAGNSLGLQGNWLPPAGNFNPFGQTVVPVGDLDSDGFPDVAVGAKGGAFVISGRWTTTLYSIVGGCTGQVALGPDIDGDGNPELALGHFSKFSWNGSGAVNFYDLGGNLVSSWLAAPSQYHLGISVVHVGDVDGDGFAEVAAGSHTVNSAVTGRVDVYSPKLATLLWSRESPEHGAPTQAVVDGYAFSLGGGGDVDLDGRPDVVVGADRSSLTGLNHGAVYVYDGGDGDLLNSPLPPAGTNFSGPSLFGHAVAMLGDVNGDAAADVGAYAVGQPGTTYAYSCRTSGAQSWGTGCPGSGGFVPLLDASFGPGNTVTLNVTQALGSSVALFTFGLYPANTLASWPCSLWLQPLLPILIVAPTTGTGPGGGAASLAFNLPPGFQTVVMSQAFISDPPTPPTYSATNGVQLTIH